MRGYTQTYKINGKEIEVIKIDYDVNGNPRYVIWYRDVLRLAGIKSNDVLKDYEKAIRIARERIFGKKYRAK